MVDALASWPGRGPTGGILSASIAAIELQLVPIHVLLAPWMRYPCSTARCVQLSKQFVGVSGCAGGERGCHGTACAATLPTCTTASQARAAASCPQHTGRDEPHAVDISTTEPARAGYDTCTTDGPHRRCSSYRSLRITALSGYVVAIRDVSVYRATTACSWEFHMAYAAAARRGGRARAA